MTGRAVIFGLGLLLACGCARESGSPRNAARPSDRPEQPTPPGEAPLARVLESSKGEATYYADSLAGRPTASGEKYDPSALTAAHRTLPFGTRVRVTREHGGRSVVVRINDRGPFGKSRRIIDLSRRAAEELDMIRAGVVPVQVDVLEAGPE